MKEIELIKNLRSLKSISPRAEYASHSKMVILSFQRKLHPQWEIVGRGVLAESFNFGLSMVLTAVILVLILGGATSLLRPIFLNNLPGVDAEGLITEADTITKDIDIQLSEAEYYAVTAKETSVALKETSLNGPAHVNPLLIQNEIKTLDFENPKNSNIDDLLNKLSQ